MNQIPQDVIDHCEKHPGCKGCPLKSCVAPVTPYPDPRWDRWLSERIANVRSLYAESAS